MLDLPPELIAAARRILDTTTHNLPLIQLVTRLAQPGEVIDSATLAERLESIGRPHKTSAINNALHRAATRGQLERIDPGRYRQPLLASNGSPDAGSGGPDLLSRQTPQENPDTTPLTSPTPPQAPQQPPCTR